jgi:hypothetical protein
VGERAKSTSADDVVAALADPAWLPHRVLDEGRLLQFVKLSRDELRALSFLNKLNVGESLPRIEIPVTVTMEESSEDSASCHYIFHSAFCCSTLMARALDIEAVAITLKEPQAFMDLVRMMPQAGPPDHQRLALEVVVRLMQRPRVPGEKVIIKPANPANPLIEQMLALSPGSRALLMYAPLEDFLLAVARGRRLSWARNIGALYRDHLEFGTKRTRDLVLLTDFEMAAFLWLQQQAQFARLLRDLPERLASLRSDLFLEQPTGAVSGTAELFGLALPQGQAAAITSGPLFQSHSKRPGEKFDESSRKREEALVKMAYGPEIQQALEWAGSVAEDAGVPFELPGSII